MLATDCIWRRLLPSSIALSAGSWVMSRSQEHEETFGIAMGDWRWSEFSTGRTHARAALCVLGVTNVELPPGPNRAPLWPDGTRGSITHASKDRRSYVAVAVGRSAMFHGIGIDVEFVSAIEPRAWLQFLTARELEFVRKLPIAERARATAAIWCAKEAATKAVGRSLEPSSIETMPLRGIGETVLLWSLKLMDRPEDQTPLLARTACYDDLAFAAVTLPRSIRERYADADFPRSIIRTEGKSSGLGYQHG